MVKPTKAFPPMAPRPITPPKPKESAPALRFATDIKVTDPERKIFISWTREELGLLLEALAWVTGPAANKVWGKVSTTLAETERTLKSNPPAPKKKKK